MSTTGLRARRKQQARELIAAAAARLFAEHGYERVAVIDVARAADVSEQTVYNHFPTKEHLVLDRDEELRDRLVDRIRSRPAGVSPAAAIRQDALSWVAALASLPAEQVRGGLGYLGVRSRTVRRLSLEMTDRHADAIATALRDTTPQPAVAKLHAIAIAWVFQTVTDETGRRTEHGHAPAQIARELRPIVAAMVDALDA
ncbi:MAG: TetR/AcrR family transcriptional regulator [bacterium]|jgi:AcrR family transcriptional regulator|nr:TetR/AcrR family transcriptional regulator [bacterium]